MAHEGGGGFDIRNIFAEFRQNQRADALRHERSTGVQALLGAPEQALPQGQQGPPQPGQGLLADPGSLQRQVEFAGGLEALPGGGGVGLLGQILGQGEAGERAAAGLSQRGLETEQQESQFARGLAEEQRQFDNPQIDPLTAEDTRKAEQARINNPFNAFNPLTMGQPGGGVVRVDPKLFAAQQKEHDTTMTMLQQANRAQELIDEFGGELWNAEAVGEMVNIRANLLLRSSGLRGAGAPQGAELEISGRGLPDPNSLWANVTSPFAIGERDRWASAYKAFGEQIQDSALSQLGVNPTLASNPDGFAEDFISKRGISPEMWQFFQEQRGQRIE